MTRPAQTYSVQKQLIKTALRPANIDRNNMFDQIFPEENVFDNSDSYGQSDHEKMAAPKSRKRKRNKNKNLKEIREASGSIHKKDSSKVEKNDASLALFCDDKQIKKKTKNTKKLKNQIIKVKQKTNHKFKKRIPEVHEQHCSDTSSMSPACSENLESNEGYVVEDIIAQKDQPIAKASVRPEQEKSNFSSLRENHSKLQDSLCSESIHQTDIDSSAEIPRDATQSSAPHHGSLTQSPLVCLVLSDEDSLANFRRTSRKAEVESCLADDSLRPTDLFPSCERVETSDQFSRMGSSISDYTYSYVSTYTEATCTGSVKTGMISPPVKMKMSPTLNSTPCKGKECIGVIEFPDFISPVGRRKGSLLPQARPKAAVSRDQRKSLKMTEKIKHTPKCSTVLFGSDISSCLPLDSVNLTTINSKETLTIGESQLKTMHPKHRSDRVSSLVQSVHQVTPTNCDDISIRQGDRKDCRIERRQWKSVKTSTPQDDEQKLALSISPIELQIHESDDETELQVNSSTVVNSDEIIVPSLMELTGLSGNSSQMKVGNKSDSVHCKADRRNKKNINSPSGQIEACHPKSSNKNTDKGNSEELKTPFSDNTFPTAGKIPSCSIDSVSSVEANDKNKAGFQIAGTDSDSKQIRARKLHKYDSRELCTPLNENYNATEIHKVKGCYSNQFHVKAAKKSKHYRVLGNSDNYQEMSLSENKQYLLRENNSVQQEAKKTLSDEPSKSVATKKCKCSETVHNVCYINRLCMASQKKIFRAVPTNYSETCLT